MATKPDDSLRMRALARAKGDYEVHEVSATSNGYESACRRGDDTLARWAEERLRMFADTQLTWKQACSACSAKGASKGAKAYGRIRIRLGKWPLPVDRDRIRANNRRNGD